MQPEIQYGGWKTGNSFAIFRFEWPNISQVLRHVEKKFQQLPMFSRTDCRMVPKSMFGDFALNQIRKYAGRKNNIAATKPEVIVSQYAGS